MVFTVSCPECDSRFPVDSAKVPEGGVTAQCGSCPATFLVEVPEPEAAHPVEALAPDPTDLDTGPDDVAASDAPVGPPAAGPAEPAAEPAAESQESAVAVDAPAAFGQQDPDARAARLARVLVSDMMTYNPKMYEKALEAGTLVEDFEEEVKKSWSEYVEQVGPELAGSTQHFTRALNDILAKGEELFSDSMYE